MGGFVGRNALKRGSGFKRKPMKRKMRLIARKRPSKRGKSKKRTKSHSYYLKALDAVFSTYIRTKYSKDGLVKCFTCSKTAPIKQMQNGHYISRSVKILRWHEDNCRPQCIGCNIFKNGNLITYRENLVKEIGEEVVRFIEASRHTFLKPTKEWMIAETAKYKSTLSAIE